MPLEQARSDDWAPVPTATPQTVLGIAEGTGPVRKMPVPPPPPPEAMRPRRR